jgi:protein-S-isoprenylcysteine O-methyltransferase Ste14
MRKRFDPWSILVIALTLVLFVVALFVKGVQHDLLLETGVFLVSVKLILMSHKSTILGREVVDRLDQIHDSLRVMRGSSQLPEGGD